MGSRSSSWMDEVGKTTPRRPSANGLGPLLPYQIPTHDGKPYGYRPHSFSGGQAQGHRAFGPPIGLAITPAISEEAIGDGSDGGSDIIPHPFNRRLSTPASVINQPQTPYVPSIRTQWPGDQRINLSNYSMLAENDGIAAPATPISPTGVSHMRKLTAELANVPDSAIRDTFHNFDSRDWSSQPSFAQLPPFQDSHYIPTRGRPSSGELDHWETHAGGRAIAEWQSQLASHTDTLQFAVVVFKMNRADVFYFHKSGGMTVTKSSIVVVDADRGQDLGTVFLVTESPIEAHDVKRKLNRQHYEALLQMSRTARPPGWSTENSFNTYHDFNSSCAYAGGFHLGDVNSSVRKAIKRLAFDREIQLLDQRRELEDRAKRLCILAVQRHGLHLHEMEILDAEFQHDFNKLTFYFLSPQYLHFNPLVTELFKLFKTRIWMSALNPASCVAPPPLQMGRGAQHWYDPSAARVSAAITPRLRGRQNELALSHSNISSLDLQV